MPRRKSNKKWLWWVLFLVLIGVAAIIVYLVWDNYFKEKPASTSENNGPVVVAPVDDEPHDEIVAPTEDEQVESEEVYERKTIQYEGEEVNRAKELSGIINYTGVSGGVLLVRTSIYQYLESGECTLKLLSDGVVVKQVVAEIASGATSSFCNGFDVPIEGLSGDYQIVIDLSSGGKIGEIKGEVSI